MRFPAVHESSDGNNESAIFVIRDDGDFEIAEDKMVEKLSTFKEKFLHVKFMDSGTITCSNG